MNLSLLVLCARYLEYGEIDSHLNDTLTFTNQLYILFRDKHRS